MATKRWSYGIRSLIEDTDSLVAEIDGKLLSQKLSAGERLSLINLKLELKKKLKLKKSAFKIETVDSFRLRAQNLEREIDSFPNENVTKEKYTKIPEKQVN